MSSGAPDLMRESMSLPMSNSSILPEALVTGIAINDFTLFRVMIGILKRSLCI
jgi:hypothetical protein